jgi:DNA repair exonuclease SbcCD ATPase subunit
MNNDEGGIDELFEKCNTSDGVLNDWIIKTVENGIIKTSEEDMQIYDLMDGLVANTVKNEEYIRDQKNMKSYFEDHIRIEKSLETVYLGMDAYAKTEEDMNRFHNLLTKEISKISVDLDNFEVDLEELSQRLQTIVKEEVSEAYYNKEEQYIMFYKEEIEAKNTVNEINTLLESKIEDRDIQNAAKLYKSINDINGKINALLHQIMEKKQDTVIGDHLEILKYSLKKAYEEEIYRGNHTVEELNQTFLQSEGNISNLKQQLNVNYERRREIGNEIAVLHADWKRFLLDQETLFDELQIGLTRNLLGYLEEKQAKEVSVRLVRRQEETKKQILELEKRVSFINERISSINEVQLDLSGKIVDRKHEIDKLKEDKAEFEQQESICSSILKQYEIPFEKLYKKTFLQSEMEKRLQRLEKTKLSFQEEVNQIKEMLEGINSGCVYFPKALTTLLEEKDIMYQTGETYLNTLEEEKRLQLLQSNPLLPFSMIIKKKDLTKLDAVKFNEILLRQILPVFTYDTIDSDYSKEHELIITGTEFAVAAFYEEKLFVNSERQAYISRLQDELVLTESRVMHLLEEMEKVRDNQYLLNQFQYHESFIGELLSETKVKVQELESFLLQMEGLQKEKTMLEEEKPEANHLLEVKKAESTEEGTRITRYEQFLISDKEHRKKCEYCNSLEKEERELKELVTSQEQEKDNIVQLQLSMKDNLRVADTKLKENKKKLEIYSDATQKDLIQKPIIELEQEYNTLLQGIDRNITELERSLEEKRNDLAEKLSELEQYSIEEERYRNVDYDENTLKELKKEITLITKELKEKNGILSEIHDNVIRTKTDLDNSLRRIKELGLSEPLDKAVILQNYENRRKLIYKEQGEVKEKQKALGLRLNLCKSKSDLIQNTIALRYVPYGDMKLEADIDVQYKDLNHQYKEAANAMDISKKNYVADYTMIRKKNEDKHPSITDILNSVETLHLYDSSTTSDKVYYYLEELMKKRESLSKYLEFYEQQLQMIEHTKNQVIDQCMSYAMLIYEGIQAISDKSRIRLSGKSRSIQMLKITIPTEIDSNAEQRMKDYMEYALELAVSDFKENVAENKDRQYRNRIRNLVSARALLDVIIGTNKIPVSVYKIDLNEKNSGMKRWEDAMAQNSGGEKFVVFFTMISTLISYTRDALGKRDSVDSRVETKVMIMDNPFARTSSEHLLKAVIDIAKTFHIQLICLSDLSQSSITNRFSLIYMLSVRRKMYSDSEQLKIENVQMNKDGLVENERLEHATLHYQIYEQESLFGWMEE